MEEENVNISAEAPAKMQESVSADKGAAEQAQSAASKESEKPVDLGKFKSVDALLRAYGELEAEFTRRSQRLKALEEQSKEREEPTNGQTEPLSALEHAQQSGVTGEELYRAVMNNEGVRARVLSDYLQSLKGVPLLAKTGTGVVAPASRPKSIAEAGNLALGYFKNGK